MVSNNLLHIMFSDDTKNFHFSQPFFSVHAVCSLPWPLPAPQILIPSPPRPALRGGGRSLPRPVDFCPYLSPPRPVKKIASRSIPGGDNTSSWNCSSCRSSLSSPSSSSLSAIEYVEESKRVIVGNLGLAVCLTLSGALQPAIIR